MTGSVSSLFGRDREVAELRAVLQTTIADGPGSLALLVGEPGIGKTRLANEIANEASARGAQLTWGRAWEAGGAPAYWPWIEALRPFTAVATTESERARLAPLAHLLPDLPGCEPSKAGADPAQDRFRLFEAVATFLGIVARERPLVVVLDDLHVADVGSLLLLHFIARTLRSTRVFVIGTYRDVEARLSAEAGEALSKVAREGRYFALRRLERNEVALWASAEGVADAETVFTATEGNPLFVVEILRLARDRGATLSGQLPDGVRDVIRARLALLSPRARALLDAASVLGRTIDLGVVSALVREPMTAVRDLAAEAVKSSALVESGDRTSFSHILIREVLYQDMPSKKRAELHAGVARVLLDRYGNDPDASLAEAVHHLFAAAPEVPHDEAITWARRGAERAVRRLAFEEAADLLSRATELLPPGRDEEKCDLFLELAAAQGGAGEATRGRETALAAANIARRLGDAERLARAALQYGAVFMIAIVDRVLVGLLDEGLAALPTDDSPLRAQLLARLAAALQPAPDPEHPNTLAREAISMARRVVTDEPTHLSVLVSATSALAFFGDPHERLPLDTELIKVATRLGDRIAVLRALMRLAYDHLELGDTANADMIIEEYDSVSRAVGLPSFRWRALLMRSMRAIMEERFADSEALCAEASAIAARVDDASASFSLALHEAGRLSAQNDLDALAAHLPSTLELLSKIDVVYKRSFRCGMLARIGRAAEARDDLEFLTRHDPPLRGRPMFVWAADACLALRDRATATMLVPLLTPVANRQFFWSPAAIIMEKRSIASVIEQLADLQPESKRAAPVAARPSAETFELVKEGDLWTIKADTTFRLRDSRGLAILAQLVAHPGRELHAADLLAPGGEPGHVEDAGDVLDAQAITAYKRRLEDLRDAEAEASRNNDDHRASRIREEIEALSTELARGVGLGGRGRKASSSAEKARINVRKRLLDAITRIGEHSPALAKHLKRAIRTGTFCSYEP